MYSIFIATLLIAAVSAKGKPSPVPLEYKFYSDDNCTVVGTAVTGQLPVVLGDACQPIPAVASAESIGIVYCPLGTCFCNFYATTDCTGVSIAISSPAGTVGGGCTFEGLSKSVACRDNAN
jgi:hypothetical protein